MDKLLIRGGKPLLGSITTLETARKDLQAQVYNNTVG